jgi:hypothetical protein
MYIGLGTCYYPPMRTNAHNTNYTPNSRPKLPLGTHTQSKFLPKSHTPKLHIVQAIGKKLYSGKIRENMTKSAKKTQKKRAACSHTQLNRTNLGLP